MTMRTRAALCACALAMGCGVARDAAVAAPAQMTFVKRPVSTPLTEGIDGSRSLGNGLYEPTVVAAPCSDRQRCPTGVVLYYSAHVVGLWTTRAPVFDSLDRGATWHTLPGLTPTGSTRAVGGAQGDEGIMAADGSGRAWLFD